MLEKIHQTSLRILAEVGIRIDDDQMRSLLKANGIKIDRNTAFFTENDVAAALSKAPEMFKVSGRNKSRSLSVGGSHMHYLPGYGAPGIMENNIPRKAMLDDYVTLVKLVHSIDEMPFNGGILVQPDDIPADKFQLILYYVTALFSDKPLLGMTGSRRQQDEIMAFLEIVHDGRSLTGQPVILTLVNTTSPLILDAHLLQTLYVCARYHQPIIFSPSPMAGTTGPIDMTANVALGNAEILAALTCTQIAMPGTPVVYGLMAQPADMQTCAIDPGSPGAVAGTILCAKLARHYGLPSRGGTAPNAREISVLSGLERMMITLAATNAGVNLMIHTAGLLDRFNCMAPEQLLIDVDIIRRIAYLKNFFAQDTMEALETTYFDEIKKAGPGGNFLTAMSTLKHCREAPFVSQFQSRPTDTTESENQAVIDNARKELDRMLARYKPPRIEAEKHARMRGLLVTAGVPEEILDRVDQQHQKAQQVNQ